MHLIIDCTTTQNQLKYNGVGQYTKHILKGLIERANFDITLLLFEKDSTIDPYLKNLPSNIKVERIGSYKVSDYLNYLWYKTRILPTIKKVRREDSIYFCPYFWAGIPSRHIPTVLAVHDFILPKFNIYSEQSPVHNFVKKILYWMEMYKARYCKEILTCSKYTARDFLEYFPKYDKKHIHPIYLDGEVSESINSEWNQSLPKDYKERGYFIYMGGALGANKNSEGVVKGYREFLTKYGNDNKAPYLVIAGKNFTKEVDPKVGKFKAKIECLGLKNNVIFTGFYEDTHVKPLLQNSISFLHLSLYEGFGIALVEAMKAGTPVIAHNGSCYPEVLQNGGMLVDGTNEKEVGNTMYKIYKDKRLREELINKGKERSSVFSWDITVEKTIEVFQSVLKD